MINNHLVAALKLVAYASAAVATGQLIMAKSKNHADQLLFRIAWLCLVYLLLVGGPGVAIWSLRPPIGFTVFLTFIFDDVVGLFLFSLPICAALRSAQLPCGPLCRWVFGDAVRGAVQISWRGVGVTLVWSSVAVSLSSLMWSLSSGEIGAFGKQLLEMMEKNFLFVFWLALRASVAEEFFYRGFLFCWFANRLQRFCSPKVAWLLAAAGSSFLFSLAHGGYLLPEWVKVMQTFGLGMGACFIFWRYGLEMAILFHAAFNFFVLALEILLSLL